MPVVRRLRSQIVALTKALLIAALLIGGLLAGALLTGTLLIGPLLIGPLLTEPLVIQLPFFLNGIFPGGCRPPHPPLGRRNAFLLLFWICKILCAGYTSPGRYLIFSSVKTHLECTENHVWGPPGTRDMTMFVKHEFFPKEALGENLGKKSIQNYIDWCSQSTKQIVIGRRYSDYDNIIS